MGPERKETAEKSSVDFLKPPTDATEPRVESVGSPHPGAVRQGFLLYSLAMSYRANGKLHAVFETEQKTERFRKRDFVLEISDGNFEQHVKFQLTGDRCEALDEFSTGDDVEVEFSLRGREWKSPQGDIRYFSNLDVWTVHRAAEGARGAPPSDEPPPPEEPPHFGEDPPF